MQTIIAMAGLAEAAIFYGLVIFGAILLIVIGLAAFALWRCAPLAGVLACITCVMSGLWFQVWSPFFYTPSSDPDDVYWLSRCRLASTLWIVCFVAVVTTLIVVTRRWRAKVNANTAA